MGLKVNLEFHDIQDPNITCKALHCLEHRFLIWNDVMQLRGTINIIFCYLTQLHLTYL